jgi:hypothetical protein
MPVDKRGNYAMNPKVVEMRDNAPEEEPESSTESAVESPDAMHGKMMSISAHPDNKGGFNVAANYHHEKKGAHQVTSHHGSAEEAGAAMMEHMKNC